MRATRPMLMVLAVVALAACGEADETTTAAQGDNAAPPVAETETAKELLFLGLGTGVRVYDPETEAVTLDAAPAVPSQQGNAVYRTVDRSGGTEVANFDPESGSARWSTVLPTPMELRVASQDGSAAVLGPLRSNDPSVAIAPRETTQLTVVRGTDDVETYDVPGNVEPETFSADASKLFLIDYLPPLAPTSYTLRLLDLETGEVGEVFDAHGGHREPMEGTARKHVFSPDGTRLYTYYEILGDPYYEHGDGPYRAFVHVLDLEDEWAHCVVLPDPFGTLPGSGAGLTVSPDGEKVYVADALLGKIAEIDAEMLRVFETADVAPPPYMQNAELAATETDLLLAVDNKVSVLDRETLTPKTEFTIPSRSVDIPWVTAFYVSRLSDYVYLALAEGRVEVYDTATYQYVDDLVVGAEAVEYLHPSDVPLDATDDVIKCAC